MIIHLRSPSPDTSSDLPGNHLAETGYEAGHFNVTIFDLAPCGVCHAFAVTREAVRSYRTISPLPLDSPLSRFARGGIFSVPLSVRLPCPGVTRRTALWSSDFPPFALRRTAIVWSPAAEIIRPFLA